MTNIFTEKYAKYYLNAKAILEDLSNLNKLLRQMVNYWEELTNQIFDLELNNIGYNKYEGYMFIKITDSNSTYKSPIKYDLDDTMFSDNKLCSNFELIVKNITNIKDFYEMVSIELTKEVSRRFGKRLKIYEEELFEELL